MKSPEVRVSISAGAMYLAIGLIFGLLAGRATTSAARIALRWAAWIVSIVVFGGHIVYERIQLDRSSLVTAGHASTAAAAGAFGLAVAANIHAYVLSLHEHSFALHLSLIIWPAITAAPAFLVALAGAVVLGRLRQYVSRQRQSCKGLS